MSLRIRVILFILLLSVTFCAVIYLIADRIIIQNFKALETRNITNNLIRAENALDARIQQVDAFTTDYAVWDDTYQFVQDQNQQYIKANLIDQTYINSKVNVMVILDSEGNQLFAKAYDFFKKEPLVLPTGLEEYLKPGSELVSHKSQESGVSGIIVLPDHTLLISSHPITTSDKKMPSNGTFIMARYLDSYEQTQLNATANLTIEFIPYKNKQELAMIEDIDAFLKNKTAIKPLNENEAVGYSIKKDIFGSPQLISKITITRDIYKQGRQTLTYFLFALAGIVFVSCAAGVIFIENITLGPLQRLLRDVNNISSTGKFSGRVEVTGSDDIANLATTINKMLGSLQKTDTSLLEANKRLNQQAQIVEEEVNERTEELHEEQARFVAAIESISAGFLLTDNNGKVIISNNNFRDILNIKEKNITLETIQNKFHPYFDLISEIRLCITEKKRKSYEHLSLNNQYIRIYIAPVVMNESKDQIVGVVTVIHDITEATLLERAKEEFFSIASHELRTPLTAIKGNTEIIKEHFLKDINKPDLNEIINDIYVSSIRLIDIVNTFLTTSRLEQNRIKFNRIKFDPVVLTEEVIRSLSSTIDSKGLKVTVENRNKKPLFMSADRQRTEQVLINLLGNAIKFTDKGKINIVIEKKDNFIEISVEDTGKGIPEHEQNLLFKKFQQASTNIYTRDTSHGTGLGLYICKLMVEGMGGTIYLKESFVSRGSKFAFTLPAA